MPSIAAIRVERIIVVPLSSYWTRAPRQPLSFILRLDCSSTRQKGLGLTDFNPIGVGVLGQLHELAIVGRGLVLLLCSLCGLCRAVQAAQSVGRRLERSLVFVQCLCRLLLFQQEVAQQ